MAKVLEEMSNYIYTEVDNGSQTISCPRYMNDVYTLGIDLQYYIGDIYLQMAEISRGDIRSQYKKMAVSELEIKEKIEKINNARLNELLTQFYNNGGQIIEAPLTSDQAKELQPFFNRLLDTYFKRLESLLVLLNLSFIGLHFPLILFNGSFSLSELQIQFPDYFNDFQLSTQLLFQFAYLGR
jgi:hypothetical protein